MNELLNAIFGIGGPGEGGERALGFGSPEAQLSFVHPLPAWAVVLIVIALGALVWWSYRRLPGTKRTRGLLAGLRLAALTVLLLVILGPRIEQTTIRTEPDWAMVLLDRSGSMSTADAGMSKAGPETGPGSGAPMTRGDQERAMLDASRESWSALAQEKRVVWMGFSDRATVLATGVPPDSTVLEGPLGLSTNLGGAIAAALERAAARPVSAIVLASDGRGFDAIDPDLLNALRSAQIPIIAVPLGSDQPLRDLGVARVQYPDAVFGRDIVPVRVRVETSGFSAADLQAANARVELVDHATGRVLDSAPITDAQLDEGADGGAGEGAWVALMHTPEGTGEHRLDARIALDRVAGVGEDLNASNDGAEVRFTIVERPMRVLYIDGYPRWEERYLKNLLLREPSIVSSSLMLSASRRYIQEGDELIGAAPSTLADWEPFDVVILGDVRPEMFSRQQLGTLLKHVETRGAGVLWAAGPNSTPQAWKETALEPLLPMRKDAAGSQAATGVWDTAVTMRASDEALRLGLLGLSDDRRGWPERLSDPATGWSRLQWALALDATGFKPGVGVLATARGVGRDETAPIVTMMRYGAGRSVLVGTDEIWRWRYGRGEDLPERFWLPLIRSLGRGTVERRAAPANLTVTPEHPAPGKPARVTLRLYDQSAIDSTPEQVNVTIDPGSGVDAPQSVVLTGGGDTRAGTWVPEGPGLYSITPQGLDLSLAGVSASVRVLDQSDERRLLDTDHGLLASLAEQTGGRVVAPEDFATIPDLLPNRTRTIASPARTASLWDRPVVLIVLVVLLSGEWLGRRLVRLA